MKLFHKATSFLRGRAAPPESRLLFALAGGSAAWPEMGRALYRENEVFRDSIATTGAVVEQVLGWDAVSHFRGRDDSRTTTELERRNEIIHLGMLQIAQVDQWREAGFRPGGVLAVSLGEMIAPYAAGALSRDDCARVLCSVSHAISRRAGDERMFIVRSDRAGAQRLVRSAPASLHYIGSPGFTAAVLLARGGDAPAIRDFLGDALMREVATEWNYHTPALDVDRAWLEQQLAGVRTLTPFCPIYSSVAGGRVPTNAPFDAQFFAWMVSRPFLYADALSAALREGFETVVTLGPQPSNNGFIIHTARSFGRDVRLIDTMHANHEEQAWRDAVSALRRLRIAAPRPTADLFENYESLRRAGPVHYVPDHDHWVLLGYKEVQAALADLRHFSSDMADLHRIDPVLLGSDPPDHDRARRVVSRYFSAAAVARRTELGEQIAARLWGPLAQGAELDVVHDVAQPLAAAIAADLVALDPSVLNEQALAAEGDLEDLYDRMHEPLSRLAPHSPLYGQLLGDGFDDEAARSLIRLLWIAGTTPQHAVAPAILLLLGHPDARRRIQADESVLGAFVEEALRLHPPSHLLPRVVTEDVTIGGKTIPAGAQVRLNLAAANRDPACFDDPAALRLDRGSNPHLSFGGGVHRCIGASLGRGLLAAALRALFRVAPDFRAVQPLSTVRFATGATLHEIEQLVIGP